MWWIIGAIVYFALVGVILLFFAGVKAVNRE